MEMAGLLVSATWSVLRSRTTLNTESMMPPVYSPMVMPASIRSKAKRLCPRPLRWNLGSRRRIWRNERNGPTYEAPDINTGVAFQQGTTQTLEDSVEYRHVYSIS